MTQSEHRFLLAIPGSLSESSLDFLLDAGCGCYPEEVNKMVFSNLVHRPLRTMISVFAISIEVTLILLIVGLCLSMLNDSAKRTEGRRL